MTRLDTILEKKTSLSDWISDVTAPVPSLIRGRASTTKDSMTKLIKSLKKGEVIEIDDEHAEGQLVTVMKPYSSMGGLITTGIDRSTSKPFKVDKKGRPVSARGSSSTIEVFGGVLKFITYPGEDEYPIVSIRKVLFK